jgi:acetolactate synthase-1/2/3 large subunit
MPVAQAVAGTLHALGVDTVFGLMGRMNLRMVIALTERYGGTYIAARHESAAVAMALGHGRATGRLGVATVTWGPGVTNTVTPVVEAQKARVPLLLLAGDGAPDGKRDNQYVDQRALFGSLGIAVVTVSSAETAVGDVETAVRLAVTERRPVVLSVPFGLQGHPTTADPAAVVPLRQPDWPQPEPAEIARLADLVVASAHPVIIAGRGALDAGPALTALADRTGAVLATSLDAAGLFDGHPRYVGTAGVHSSPLGAEIIQRADTIVAIGVSLNHFGTRAGHLFGPDVTIVRCDVDEAALRTPAAAVAVRADADDTARALVAELDRRGHRPVGWTGESVDEAISKYRRADAFVDETGNGFVDGRALMVELDRRLPRSRAVVPETGHACGYALDYLPCHELRSSINVIDFQAIGLGLAVAAGAAVARPDRITVAVCGDGGTLMAAGELETLVRLRLPVLVAVLNDSAYGAEARELERMEHSIDPARFPDVYFAAFAAALGMPTVTVRELADLDHLDAWMAAPGGPALIDCRIDAAHTADWFAEMVGTPSSYLRHARTGF